MKKISTFAVDSLVLALASCSSTPVSSTLSSSSLSTGSLSSSSTSASSSSSSSSLSSSHSPTEYYKTRTAQSLVADPLFENGFDLFSPETTSAHIEKTLDYDGTAATDYHGPKESSKAYWEMCQWWTPYDFKDATYKKDGDEHIYSNESRTLSVNTKTGTLGMKLNAYKEYRERFGGPREATASWSHFLIQETFPPELFLYVSDIAELYVSFDVTVDSIDYLGEGTPTGSDCAQLLFYLRLYNVPRDGSTPAKASNMWFGLPVLDTRYSTVSTYIGGDTGFTGSTNSLIYSIASNNYLGNEKIQFGKTYHVKFEVMDFLKTAFIYGVNNGYLPEANFKNCLLKYLNYGWEIPGDYSVSSSISNIDVSYVKD